jgi:hypothetical protein
VKRVVIMVLRIVICHFEKCNGQEHNVPTSEIHKYTWTLRDGKTDNQLHHILIDRRWPPNILDARLLRDADCDTDHYLVVVVGDRLLISKSAAQNFDMERFYIKKLNNVIIQGTVAC